MLINGRKLALIPKEQVFWLAKLFILCTTLRLNAKVVTDAQGNLSVKTNILYD